MNCLLDREAYAVSNLMALAKEANKAFDYDRAIGYLSTLEEIWNSKGLPEFSLDLRFELHQEKGKSFASQGRLEEATRCLIEECYRRYSRGQIRFLTLEVTETSLKIAFSCRSICRLSLNGSSDWCCFLRVLLFSSERWGDSTSLW